MAASPRSGLRARRAAGSYNRRRASPARRGASRFRSARRHGLPPPLPQGDSRWPISSPARPASSAGTSSQNLLQRGRPIYVLVRKGSEKKLAAMRKRWGADDKQVDRRRGRSRQARPRRRGGRRQEAQGQDRPPVPSRRDLRPQGQCRGAADRQRRRNEERGAVRRGGPGGMLPSRELDRRGGAVRRHVSRRHVRGGRRPRPSVLQDQARFRRARAPRLQAAVPHLPPGLRRRPLEDRRDRQDRRPVLLLQDAAEAARHAAAVDADDRHRGRPHQHRARGFRRRRARPPRAQEGARRQVLPPDRPRAAPDRRSAQHLRPRRPRAADDDARQREDVRLHPRADSLRSRLARADQARDHGSC